MPALRDVMQNSGSATGLRPWPGAIVDEEVWRLAAQELAAGRWTLLGLWAAAGTIYQALRDDDDGGMGVIALACRDGSFPSLGRHHAPALRPERAIHDLHGLEPLGIPDTRRWLDHERWGVRHPLGAHAAAASEGDAYQFLAAEGEGLHQIPVGPVHAGIIEPGHFRFTANGETVVRLEERLGYVHKGIEALMAGAPIARAARLAGRCSGDSTVAYALAFARAVEAALETAVPERAVWLRALMAELERLANHLGDIGAVCNDAAFAIMHAHCGVLREQVLRAADAVFGHRLMMDKVIPGGVAADLTPEGAARLRELVAAAGKRFPHLIELYDGTTSLQDRTVGTGRLTPELARRFGAGGHVGRASGRAFDARREAVYPPYDRLDFTVPVLGDGDVNARVWIRIREVEQSLALIEQILDRLPEGGVAAGDAGETACAGKEGIALVEGFRGDVLAWVRLGEGGSLAHGHLRDPSWFQWPLLEAAIEGNIVADFPLCNKSFNCSYSGHDL